ncbi:MAG: MBL fold metallo-hydrolase [Actinobacteria bacterium]|nr:MBL fold metallo-hydrolase [Actinomycetota bacterium]
MKVERLVLGNFGVNCYIVSFDDFDGNTIIIDPGSEPQKIISYLEERNLKPSLILNTHGHYDHIGAIPVLISRYEIPCYVHEFEEPIVLDPAKNLSSFLGENELSLKTCSLIKGTCVKNFNNLGIEVILTPGHTPGSVIIKLDKILFTGDLLFKGGIGRTDLPGGDIRAIRNSLSTLRKLGQSVKEDLIVYPGHGEETTLKYELKTNYYLRI